MSDLVNNPPHYKSHPSGVECIQITEHMSFCLGNAIKYIWRADLKNDAIEDLKKARWYLDREIQKREEAATSEEKAICYTCKNELELVRPGKHQCNFCDDLLILRHNGVGEADMYSDEEYAQLMNLPFLK